MLCEVFFEDKYIKSQNEYNSGTCADSFNEE